MRALTYHGSGKIRVDTRPDPRIEDARNATLKVTSTAISGLHIFDGLSPIAARWMTARASTRRFGTRA